MRSNRIGLTTVRRILARVQLFTLFLSYNVQAHSISSFKLATAVWLLDQHWSFGH